MSYSTDGSARGERLCLDQLMHARVAAAIVLPEPDTENVGGYQELVDSGIKLVVAHSVIEGLNAPQVVGDNYQVAYLAAKYLISLGHRDIVYLAIPQDCYMGRERVRGLGDALAEAGIPLTKSSIVSCGVSGESGEKAMAAVLKRKRFPTAVIARHDIVATGVMRAVFAAGLSIPGDISLIGNGDMELDDLLRVPLTSIKHPAEHLANMAIKKLLDMLKDRPVEPDITKMDVELVIRSSCAPPRKR